MASLSSRLSSGASSSTETQNDRDGFISFGSTNNACVSQYAVMDENKLRDAEQGEGLLEKDTTSQDIESSSKGSFGWAVFWIVVNTLATIGIVCLFVKIQPLISRTALIFIKIRSSQIKPSSLIPR